MHATAPSSGSGSNALQRAPDGAEIGPADREIEEDDRHRDTDRGSHHERAAARVARHLREPWSRGRAHDRVRDDGHSGSFVTRHAEVSHGRGSRASLAHGPDRCSDAHAIIHRCPPARRLGSRKGLSDSCASDAARDPTRGFHCGTGDAPSGPAHPRDEPVPDPARLARRHRPPLRLRPVDRRRRHLADVDGRPRGDRPRPPAHRAHHRSSARDGRGPTSNGSRRSSSTRHTRSPGCAL